MRDYSQYTFANWRYQTYATYGGRVPHALSDLTKWDRVYTARKPEKRIEVHFDVTFGAKLLPKFHTKISYIQSGWKARLSSIYDTFRENVGSDKNMIFIRAGFVYRVRKDRKRYTYRFVRNYAKGWGYDLR